VETTDYADSTDEKSEKISHGGEFEKSPLGRGLRRELRRTIEGWVKNKTTDYADSTDEKSGEISHGGHRNTEKNSKGYVSRLDVKEFQCFVIPL